MSNCFIRSYEIECTYDQAGRYDELHSSVTELLRSLPVEDLSKPSGRQQGSLPPESERVLEWLRRTASATYYDAQSMQHYEDLSAKWQVCAELRKCLF